MNECDKVWVDGRTGEGSAASVRFLELFWIIKKNNSISRFFQMLKTTHVYVFPETVLSRKTTASVISANALK